MYSSLLKRTKILYAVPHLNFISSYALLSPALACLRARPKPPCCVQVTSSSSFATVCSAGRDIAENADKGMKICRHRIVRLFVSVILCSSLRYSFEQFLYYVSKANEPCPALAMKSRVSSLLT